jgi:hypothetical protein
VAGVDAVVTHELLDTGEESQNVVRLRFVVLEFWNAAFPRYL